MTANPAFGARKDKEAEIIAKALKDAAFKQELLSNPKAAIEREVGQTLPPNIEIQVVEETPTTLYLVLPSTSTVPRELSDQQLESVAGGKNLSNYCSSDICMAKGNEGG